MHIRASNRRDLIFVWACLQAFVKARGDGLGFDLIKAEFHFDDGVSSNTASVWVDGEKQTRWAPVLPTHVTYASRGLPTQNPVLAQRQQA